MTVTGMAVFMTVTAVVAVDITADDCNMPCALTQLRYATTRCVGNGGCVCNTCTCVQQSSQILSAVSECYDAVSTSETFSVTVR